LLRAGETVPIYLNASVETGSLATTDVFSSDFIGRSEKVGRYLVRGERNQMGYQSIMTPGFVRGMEALRREGKGRLQWDRLVRPAALQAATGFAVYKYLSEYYTFAGPSMPGYPDTNEKLALDRVARDTYLPHGRAIRTGEILRQPIYGRTLDRLSRLGADSFYSGEIGHEMAADLHAHGAFITQSDLDGYHVRTESPITSTFRDLTIYSAPPPCHGLTLLMMLGLVESLGLETLAWNGPEYVEVVAWATRTAFAETSPYLGDQAFVDTPSDWLLSPPRLQFLQRERPETLASVDSVSDHTTHLSACDVDGTIVSITHSLGSTAGAGVMTPGLGFLYNNFLGHFNVLRGYHNSIMPGKRFGGACPCIVFKGGEPWMAIGSSGGPRLVSAIFQTLLNVALFGMRLEEAVAAPRIHCEEWRKLYIEPEFVGSTTDVLEKRGYDLTVTSYMGCNQAVAIRHGAVEVASDPRGGQGIGIW
jgi:gamma-glutamyltranspeptidase/glutathione hydrolase